METNLQLPQWLDNLIFNDLGAKYCRSNADMTVIDWDKKDVLNYLGTYFPRSYTESYCIFSEFFKTHPAQFAGKTELSIFDFGCGTGGEIIGLQKAISELLPHVNTIKVSAFDGNYHALRLLEMISEKANEQERVKLNVKVIPLTVEDFYDLSVLESVTRDGFDVFMTFKAICEFVTKERFEHDNAYRHIINTFLPKVNANGILLLVDVTTYNNASQEWLPRMMDAGLSGVTHRAIISNNGYNQAFHVNHSRQAMDKSKIAWRIIL